MAGDAHLFLHAHHAGHFFGKGGGYGGQVLAAQGHVAGILDVIGVVGQDDRHHLQVLDIEREKRDFADGNHPLQCAVAGNQGGDDQLSGLALVRDLGV